MTATTLYERTHALLKGREEGLSLTTISMDTKLNPHWLQAFASGKLEDPSVNRIQTLYEYLANTKLEV